ncbi:MAG: NrtA/SsuA/CpmA family ABC transporter substrate-binding protein [Zoogloeaceae bacterium]|jgi:NitT/TauT family transport system substrate-binding protein|nr:NrtA/SsuA/CpmA family ABC transporter substrate-binding protein [Zoogloeaceae bacterium]
MKHFRQWLCILAGIFPLAHPAMAENVRLAQNLAPISGLAIIAKQKGFFEKEGLDVAVSNFTSGRQALETVLGGGADFATTAEAPVTAAAFANQKIAFLARMEYSDLKTLSVAGANIGKLSDLKGKRIGFSAGTGSEVYTHALLKKAGLSGQDVTLINLRPQDFIAAAASGSIDAYNTWEPHVTNGLKALPGAKLLDTRGIYSETFNIVTTQDYLRQNEKTAAAFLKALLEAEKWQAANREEAITLVARAVDLKRADLAEIWGDYVFELTLDQRSLTILRDHAQWRIDTGNAAGGAKTLPDFNKLIFAAPLKAIAPERVKIPVTQ